MARRIYSLHPDEDPFTYISLDRQVGWSLPEVEEPERLFFDVKMCDETDVVVRALQRVGRRWPGAYVPVIKNQLGLTEVVAADTNVNVVAVANFSPLEEETLGWRRKFAWEALVLGCNAVLADFDTSDLQDEFPDRRFFVYGDDGSGPDLFP